MIERRRCQFGLYGRLILPSPTASGSGRRAGETVGRCGMPAEALSAIRQSPVMGPKNVGPLSDPHGHRLPS
jgi:hypothetical protein